jgi:hypothetical protein
MLLLPLDPSETLEPDEDTMIQEIGAAMRTIVADRDGAGPERRGAHTKSHGTLRATIEILDGISADLRHGLFASAARYEALVRTSTYPETPATDRTPNVRGMGIKVFGAPGDRIVEDPSGGLDLLFISSENVAFGTVQAFRDFMVATLTSRMGEWLAHGNRAALVMESVSASLDLLGLTYWSSTPFKLGQHVVKYRLLPVAHEGGHMWLDRLASYLPSEHGGDADYPFLRHEMQARLAAAPAHFELSLQRQRDPVTQPVEDASVRWSSSGYPWEVVARLEIPKQTFDTPEQDALGEGLRIDPWHAPLVQRPLGGLNRVRGAVYARMSAARIASQSRPVVPYPVVKRTPGDIRPVCLIQDDFDQAHRHETVERARTLFQEDPDKLPGFLMCAGAPDAGRPRIGWSVTAGRLAVHIALNVLANKAAAARKARGTDLTTREQAALAVEERVHEALGASLGKMDDPAPATYDGPSIGNDTLAVHIASRVDGILGGGSTAALNLFNEDSKLYMYNAPVRSPRPASMAELTELYRKLPQCPASADLRDDATFVRRRLVGPNAPFLRRVAAAADVGFADSALRSAGDSADRAAGEGRLFVCDYSALADLEGGKVASDGSPLYLYAPTCVLVAPPGGGQLRPVAIRTAPGAEAPVVTPGTGWGWEIAKHAVEVADITWFEPITHLGLTHLVLEPAGLATFRNLPPNHPIARLLLCHTEGTLSVNNSAVHKLLADGGSIDQTFAAHMTTIRRLAVDAAVGHDLRKDALPALLTRQGLDDRNVLREHPWRDDALRVHGAIGRWVTAYVSRTYRDDAAVGADPELRAWAAALGRPAGRGGITGFGSIDTRADLATVLTELVYLASAGHAAVNFPQWTDAGFAGRMPGAGWGPLPDLRAATEADLLALLPPLDKAELQAEFLYLLGGLYYTRLGRYEAIEGGVFDDPVVRAELLPAFQKDLADIEAQIEAENADTSRRTVPYLHLLPSRIPQSINV